MGSSEPEFYIGELEGRQNKKTHTNTHTTKEEGVGLKVHLRSTTGRARTTTITKKTGIGIAFEECHRAIEGHHNPETL
jgi:hypothetical protein